MKTLISHTKNTMSLQSVCEDDVPTSTALWRPRTIIGN